MADSCRELLEIRALKHGVEFDPKTTSNSTLRTEIARAEIPEFVGQLVQDLEDGHDLTTHNIEVVFRMYGRFFETKKPSKQQLPLPYGHVQDKKRQNKEWNIKTLLELRDPGVHSRQIVYLLIQGLRPTPKEEVGV